MKITLKMQNCDIFSNSSPTFATFDPQKKHKTITIQLSRGEVSY